MRVETEGGRPVIIADDELIVALQERLIQLANEIGAQLGVGAPSALIALIGAGQRSLVAVDPRESVRWMRTAADLAEAAMGDAPRAKIERLDRKHRAATRRIFDSTADWVRANHGMPPEGPIQ